MDLGTIRYKDPFGLLISELTDDAARHRERLRRSFAAEVSDAFDIRERIMSGKSKSGWYQWKQGKAFNWAFSRNYEDLLGDAWFMAKHGADRALSDVLFEMRRTDIQNRWNARKDSRIVNPEKVQQTVESPKFTDTKTQNKVVKEELKKPKQSPYERKDQKTVRNRAYRQARIVKDVDLSKIDIEKMSPKEIYDYNRRSTKLRKRMEHLRKQASSYSETAVAQTQIGENFEQYEARITKRQKRKLVESRLRPVNQYQREVARGQRAYAVKPLAERKAEKEAGKLFGKEALKKDISTITSAAKQVFDSAKTSPIALRAKELFKQKWFRRTAGGVAVTLALNLGIGAVSRMISPPQAIPDEYERGYDIIKEYMTDFGSPVKLHKVVQKAIRPYYSTTRRALNTTVDSVINHNFALSASKNAIGHTRY